MRVRKTSFVPIIALALGLLVGPLAADAQQAGKLYRIGYLVPGSPTDTAQLQNAFRRGLRELGWVEGQNIAIEFRWAEGRIKQLPDLAAELVRLRPDVIVGASNAAIAALKQATQTIPIVMAVVGDPVGSKFVASLARPGGNITGLSSVSEEISAKWLELLKEALPTVARVGVLWVPSTPAHGVLRREIEGAAQVLGVTPQFLEVGGPDEITRAFAAMTKERAGALIALPHAVTAAHGRLIVDLAVKHRLPGMYPFSWLVEAGGLMAYAPSLTGMHRRAAYFVDRILKGAKPADLPVEQPTRFELVINMKTAKALGLTLPPSILIRADRVIQ